MTATSDYCQVVLDALWEESTKQEGVDVWVGGFMNLIERVAPKSNKGQISAVLQSSGAIHLAVRGGGPTPSLYVLNRRRYNETPEGEAIDVSKYEPIMPAQGVRRVESAIRGLNRRITVLERDVMQQKELLAAILIRMDFDEVQLEHAAVVAEETPNVSDLLPWEKDA